MRFVDASMTERSFEAGEYGYSDDQAAHTHAYLMPTVVDVLSRHLKPENRRIFDLGCGNGAGARYLADLGYEVTGVDPSSKGITIANENHPHLKLEVGSAYDPLPERYGKFAALVSLEVVEHVYSPRHYAQTVAGLLEPGGIAVLSTPYHGYWKNLALALSGRMDDHFTALWDHGHIKFWSVRTLRQLLNDVSLKIVEVHRVGRFAPIAKSMILVATNKAN